MPRFILVPDSFKGSLASSEICATMSKALRNQFPNAEIISIPVADGGEGTVDAFLAACGGEKVFLTVKGPFMEDMQSFYGLIEGGRTAVIEMAACAGLPLVGTNLHPERTTTYGVGQLISDALHRGCQRIIVGLGGSATNDLGTGCAAALGMRFLDADGEVFIPVGGTLDRIGRIDRTTMLPALSQVEIITMCDIDNLLYGPNGAAHVFSPQKGADPAMVQELDRQLRAGAETIQRELGLDISNLPGAGAAGGMGGGMVAFLGSKLSMGIEVLLDLVDFDQLLKGTDLVFTGEGRIDAQSLRGKVVIGVARRARRAGVPVIAVVGAIGEGIERAYDEGVTAIFNINREPLPFTEAKVRAKENLEMTMHDLVHLLFELGYS
jgi:glycerate kinase